MSHQDQDGRTSFPSHFQALKDALLWLFDTADLSAIQFSGGLQLVGTGPDLHGLVVVLVRREGPHAAGFEVFAVDGSRLELPRTQSNESRFSAQSARKRRRAKGAKRQKQDLVYLWPDEVAANAWPLWFCVWLSFMMEGIPVTWPPRCSMRSDSRTNNWRRSTGLPSTVPRGHGRST